MDLSSFSYITPSIIAQLLTKRAGETKVGEVISCGKAYTTNDTQFVIIGIAESIGVKGNLGIAGTHTAWEAFLQSFLNVQHTLKLNAKHIHLLGHFNFQELYDSCQSIADYRAATAQVDEAIFPLVKEVIGHGKLPIIIGGSHANAYPIIKGCSLAHQKGIAAINLDAHADFRALEGRHSGNPFSYAYEQKHLIAYAIIGLHENYNSQAMLGDMNQKGIQYTTWEDIYLRKSISFEGALDKYKNKLSDYICGIELDVDAISQTLSSAMGPSGFSVTEARQYAFSMAQHPKAAYLHLCEASTALENGLKSSTSGKFLSYLVTDFIRGIREAIKH